MITFFHTIKADVNYGHLQMQLTVPFFATVKVITINIINRQKNKTKQIIFATSAYKMKSD